MIRSRTVRARDGAVWSIRRHWAPRPRLRGRAFRRREKPASSREPRVWIDWLNPLDVFDFDGFGLFLIAVAIIVFMIFIGVPVLIFLVETLLIVPVLVVSGVLSRVLFRRPWTLEATRIDPPGQTVQWNVVGWGASDRAGDQMAGMIRATGGVPEAPAPEGPHAHRRARR
jgi:hypothetical protein